MRISHQFWIIALIVLTPACSLFSQTSASEGNTDPQPIGSVLATFQAQQQSLMQSLTFLVSQGATGQQMQAWQTQNGSLLLAQQQSAVALSLSLVPQPLNFITDVNVPDDATQDMVDFLTTRADLFNHYAELFNGQMVLGENASSTVDIEASFQKQNSAEIQTQIQQEQVITMQGNSQPLPMPPSLAISEGTSPQMLAFLTLRDQLMRQQIILWNQYLAAPPAQRLAALQQWEQQNAPRLLQMQQAIQNLSQSTTN